MTDVILFLTSPTTPEREQMSLTNLRRLKMLGKDIILMSTVPNINEEFYDLANLVVFDFFKGKIDKILYKKANDYPTPFTKPYGSYFYKFTNPEFTIYTNTNFLSVFRNTKNLIKLAYSLNYKHFFYVEDDHYFSDQGLQKLNEYFSRINTEMLNAIYFTNKWITLSSGDVIHSHFWFGYCDYFNESILHKLPENHDELESQFPISCDYETFLYNTLYRYTYNKQNVLLESVKNEGFESIFGSDSKINQIFSHFNIKDDSRINIIPYNKLNLYKVILNFRKFEMEDKFTYIKLYKNDELICGVKLRLKECINTIDVNLNLDTPTDLKVAFDDVIVKEFKGLTKDSVINNGKWEDV
jgi:hypothetical protein